MNNGEQRFLLCTNGSEASLVAMEYGVWLAGLLSVPVTLLGIVEQAHRRKDVEKALVDTGAKLQAGGIPYETRLSNGNVPELIRRVASPDKHLVIFGPMGRPLWRRWLRGRSFRHILQEINAPLIYVPALHSGLSHILVCMGGLGYARSATHWAIYLAQRSRASLTILHVVEPISYEYPTASQIQQHWKEIVETDTPQGHHLRRALEEAQAGGVAATLKVRHGDIVHEISTEVHKGHYDLIVMGSPGSSTSLRRLFMPNVTAEVAESFSLPILVAQLGQDIIFH